MKKPARVHTTLYIGHTEYNCEIQFDFEYESEPAKIWGKPEDCYPEYENWYVTEVQYVLLESVDTDKPRRMYVVEPAMQDFLLEHVDTDDVYGAIRRVL